MPMTQKAAGQILRRNAPPGEFPAFINPQEASWLKGMGGSGKKTKSGLRSYQNTGAETGKGWRGSGAFGGAENKVFAPGKAYDKAKNYVENFTPEQEKQNYDSMMARQQAGGSGGGAGKEMAEINAQAGIGNVSGGGGYDTRVPQGPSSTTNPNDPYGVQEAISTGAKNLIDREYTAPTLSPEERIAADSTETTQARGMAQKMVGTGQDAFSEAAGVGKRISGQQIDPISGQSFLTGQGVDQYMSPHTQNVIQGMQDNAMRTMQQQRGALQAQHQMAGAGIGSRGALENAAMAAEVQRGLGQQVAGALEGSYAQAAKMKQQDMQRQLQADRYNQQAQGEQGRLQLAGAAQQMAGTAAGRDAAAQDVGMISQIGADVEGKQQNILDEKMGDFYEERDWGRDNLAAAANIAGTVPSGSTTTTTGAPQYRKRDKFGRIISGAAGGWLASGGNPWGAAAGGMAGAFS
jgi:hypothetical protein